MARSGRVRNRSYGGRSVVKSIAVPGLADFARDLKAVGPEWPRKLRRINKETADKVRDVARSKAPSYGRVQGSASGAIKAYATATTAAVGVLQNTRYPYANVAFWGAKKRTGWYRSSANGRHQHPEWVGNSWDAGDPNRGPYAINRAIYESLEMIQDQYGRALEDLYAAAFPDN
jgi:hypothetical protein